MLLQNQRRYSFIRIPSSLSRSVKLSHKKCKERHSEPVKKVEPLTSQSLQESNTKLASSTWEQENEFDSMMQSLSMHRVRNACSKELVREKNKRLLPACAPLHRRPRFLQHYASVCVARDPVMLLSFYLQAAGRYNDSLDVSSLNMESVKCNEDSFPISSHLFRTDAQEHYRDSSIVQNNNDYDKVYDITSQNDIKSLEHMVRIVQQMAVCVGASISRNAWPPWVTYFFEVREPQLEKIVSEESNQHSQESCKETRLDLELTKLHTSRYRVGDTQQISKDHSFSPLIVEARCLLQSTTLELLENNRQKEMNTIEKDRSSVHDMFAFDILRLFAALCAICIAPSRTEAVSLARNILAKRQDALSMVGLALRTFCFANKSWCSKEDEECNDTICSSHSVEEVWLQMWEEVSCDAQTDVSKSNLNGNKHDNKEDDDNTNSISIADHSIQTEMSKPFTKFVYTTLGLDVEIIKQEYLNWHIHCLVCAKTQTRTVKLNTKIENVLQSTHKQEEQQEQQEEQESERMKMSSLTLLLTGKAELTVMHDNSNECMREFDKLSVQSVLELFALTPLSWLHSNYQVYQITGEAILKFLQHEYKLLSEEHAEKGKETYYTTTTTTTTVCRKRRSSVFSAHVQLFVRTINYLLFKLATSASLLAQHSVYHDITCLLKLFNVKTMLYALTSNSKDNNKKNSIGEAIHDEFRCNNLREVVSALYNIVTLVNCTRDKNTSRTNTTKTDCCNNYNVDASTYCEWSTIVRPTHECEIEENYRNHCEILYNDNSTGSTFPFTTTSKANNAIHHTEIAGSKLLHSGTLRSNASPQNTAHAAVNNVHRYTFVGGENQNMSFDKSCNTICFDEKKLEEEENTVITHAIRVLCNLLIAISVIPSKQSVHTTKTEMPTLFDKRSSNTTSRSHRYEFILSELPHKMITHVLEELLTYNYTAQVVQLCSCIVAHDLIDLRYYNLQLLAKLCQTIEEWKKNKYIDSPHSTGVYDEEWMNANDFARHSIIDDTIVTMSLEDMNCVYEKLQKLYKRRSEVFGETMATYNNTSVDTSVDKQKNNGDINVDSESSELYNYKHINKSCTDSNDSKHNQSKVHEEESEFAMSLQVPTSLSPLTQWGLAGKHADLALLQNDDAKHEIMEFDKSQSCLYARKVASLYQLQHKPQVVSLLHSLLTRVSPLLGGGFTIDRQPHYYNFGEWQVKGNVSTSSSAL